ncbi:hypothetical protein RP20_CCG005182 [Aedes albopictus]|nr:hypothetical protein RP20_CCG005182 [Aedes albopictus]
MCFARLCERTSVLVIIINRACVGYLKMLIRHIVAVWFLDWYIVDALRFSCVLNLTMTIQHALSKSL